MPDRPEPTPEQVAAAANWISWLALSLEGQKRRAEYAAALARLLADREAALERVIREAMTILEAILGEADEDTWECTPHPADIRAADEWLVAQEVTRDAPPPQEPRPVTACTHEESTFYRAAINEDGWHCLSCKRKLGFRPDLDRELLYFKVLALLDGLVNANLVNVSNGSMGEVIVEGVMERCVELGRRDQYTILREILLNPELDTEGHGEHWRKQARRRGLREAEKPLSAESLAALEREQAGRGRAG